MCQFQPVSSGATGEAGERREKPRQTSVFSIHHRVQPSSMRWRRQPIPHSFPKNALWTAVQIMISSGLTFSSVRLALNTSSSSLFSSSALSPSKEDGISQFFCRTSWTKPLNSVIKRKLPPYANNLAPSGMRVCLQYSSHSSYAQRGERRVTMFKRWTWGQRKSRKGRSGGETSESMQQHWGEHFLKNRLHGMFGCWRGLKDSMCWQSVMNVIVVKVHPTELYMTTLFVNCSASRPA